MRTGPHVHGAEQPTQHVWWSWGNPGAAFLLTAVIIVLGFQIRARDNRFQIRHASRFEHSMLSESALSPLHPKESPREPHSRDQPAKLYRVEYYYPACVCNDWRRVCYPRYLVTGSDDQKTC